MARDYKHHRRKRQYARRVRDRLLDDHEAMNDQLRKRITDLQQRLERAVETNQMLRVENAGLRALSNSGGQPSTTPPQAAGLVPDL